MASKRSTSSTAKSIPGAKLEPPPVPPGPEYDTDFAPDAPPPTRPPGSGSRYKHAPKGGLKVRAIKAGYYDDKRRRVGDVFVVAAGDPLSDKWMEPVDPRTPEKLTTGNEELRRQHDEITGAKQAGTPTGAANPLGGDDE